jgi:hypothetical protein
MERVLRRIGGTCLEKAILSCAASISGIRHKPKAEAHQFWTKYRLHPSAHKAQCEIRTLVLENPLAFAVPTSNWQVAVVGVRVVDADALVNWLLVDQRLDVYVHTLAPGVSFGSDWQPLTSANMQVVKSIKQSKIQVLVTQAGVAVSDKSSIPLEIWTETRRGNFASPGWNGSVSQVGPSGVKPELLELDRKIVQQSFHDVDFEIDAVYLWVDGADPDWQARKTKFSDEEGSHGTSANRFTSRNELYFSIATLRKNAPWINRIWLVTDNQTPDLGELHNEVTIVDHREFIPAEYLPTFNSHVITAHLHRIKGLAEHFLYLNDDILFGRPLLPTSWFDSLGRSIIRYTRTTLPGFSVHQPDVIHRSRQKTVKLGLDAGLRVSTRSIQHGPHPLRKSVIQKMWVDFEAVLKSTSQNQFRTEEDVVPEWLHNFIAYTNAKAVIGGRLSYSYIMLNAKSALPKIIDLASKRPPSVVCLNDVSELPAHDQASEKIIEYRLKKIAAWLLKESE